MAKTMTQWRDDELARLKNTLSDRMAMCCDVAGVVYDSMLNDNHSGMSWCITTGLFERFARNRNRVDIAEQELRNSRKDGGENETMADYATMCCASALEAYRKFCDARMPDGTALTDGEWLYVRDILRRMMRDRSLTPIDDTDDIWIECGTMGRSYTTYQCSRRFALFKDVYPDGTVRYHDTDAVVVAEINDEGRELHYSGSHAYGIVDSRFGPLVTFPYTPPDIPYKLYRKVFNTVDGSAGSYDMTWNQYILSPDGTRTPINEFLVETDSGEVEITSGEFMERLREAEKRIGTEEKPFSFGVDWLPDASSSWLPDGK